MLKSFREQLRKEAPAIFSLAGIAGFVGAVGLAIKATPTAMDILEEYAPDPEATDNEVLMEKAKLVVPIYLPTIGTMCISAGMILWSSQLSRYRHEAVTTMYLASQGYLYKLQERMIEEVGPKKAEVIRTKAAGPTGPTPVQYITDGNVLCFDHYSGRYFNVDSIESVRSAINSLNETLYSDSFVSINDFYYEIGLGYVEFGDQMGWFVEEGSIKLSLGSMLTEDNKPCVVVTFEVSPRYSRNGYRGGI